MINNSVSFGKSESKGASVLGAVKDSALNVGLTTLAGGTVGALGGKLASLVPYTPSEAALNAQYGDMFMKLGLKEELPDYIANKGEDIVDKIKQGAQLIKDDIAIDVKAKAADKLYSAIKAAPEADLGKEEFQNALKQFFDDADDFAFQGAKKEEIAEAIKTKFKNLIDKSEEINNNFKALKDSFIEAVSKDHNIQGMAEKSARDLRKNAIIGAGIAVGVVTALVLNILKTYGIIGKKRMQVPQQPMMEPQSSFMQPLKTTQG